MNDKDTLTTETILTDVMLRLTAMEKLLIDKGIMTREEYSNITRELAEKISNAIKDKVNEKALTKSN